MAKPVAEPSQEYSEAAGRIYDSLAAELSGYLKNLTSLPAPERLHELGTRKVMRSVCATEHMNRRAIEFLEDGIALVTTVSKDNSGGGRLVKNGTSTLYIRSGGKLTRRFYTEVAEALGGKLEYQEWRNREEPRKEPTVVLKGKRIGIGTCGSGPDLWLHLDCYGKDRMRYQRDFLVAAVRRAAEAGFDLGNYRKVAAESGG